MIRGPEASVYKGFGPEDQDMFSRTLRECEATWNCTELKPGTLDDMLVYQFELAIAQGRNAVNVLDLGCGSGAAIKNIINDSAVPERQLIPKSRGILTSHPSLTLRVVGLTDATDTQQFLQREPIILSAYSTPPLVSQQVEAEIVYYSITEAQGLGQFTEAVGMPKVDLIIATGFFCYIEGDDQFRQILSDAISVLRANGGRLLAFKYGNIPDREWSEEYISNALCQLMAFSGKDLLEAGESVWQEARGKIELSTKRRNEILEQFETDKGLSLQYNKDILIVDRVRSTPDR